MAGRWIAAALLQLVMASAQACLFARDARPEEWDAWATALFAGEVIRVAAEGPTDLIGVRVAETYKGPKGETATLQIPARMWASCRLERPALGARVLVALNANSDTLLVPLSEDYAERLRRHRDRAK